MTGPAPTSAPPPRREPAGRTVPTIFRAWRGIWLFTWKNRLAWRRLPMQLISLVLLPFLFYLATQVPNRQPMPIMPPSIQVSTLARTLSRSHPLLPTQQEQVFQIFNEEFGRAWEAFRDPIGDADAGRNLALATEFFRRVSDRIVNVLDEAQFIQYQAFQNRSLQMIANRGGETRWSRATAFYHLLIDFYFFIVLPLNCIRLSGAVIRDELQADTLGFLTTRPLSRATLTIAKYLSETAWLQLVLLVETLLIFAVGSAQQVAGIRGFLPLFLGVQFLAVLAWSGLGLFLGLTTNRYIALALVYGAIVEKGIGSIPTNINTLSITRHLKTLLAHNPALQALYDWSSSGTVLSIAALILAAGIFLGLAALLFTFFEYHHTAEMQK